MVDSLHAHCPRSVVWVLCMDDETYAILNALSLPDTHAIALRHVEEANPALEAVRHERSLLEYYFSCTPFVPAYVFSINPEIDQITYLDADLYFFAAPAAVFAEIGSGSVAIIPQRVSPVRRPLSVEKIGVYNVSWVTFRRDPNGLTALHWWCERCIEWCYNRYEDGKYGDQKYLDDWPNRFANVVVLHHKGANLARWNVGNFRLAVDHNHRVYVDGQPLIFYHFSGLTRLATGVYEPRFPDYLKPTRVLRRDIYQPYLNAIDAVNRKLTSALPALTKVGLDDRAWRRMHRGDPKMAPTGSIADRLRHAGRVAKGILGRRLLVYTGGRVF